MSIPALKLKVLNERFVDLCRFVAERSGLSEEDSDAIFRLETAEFQQVRPSSIRLSIEEGRPVDIRQKGPIVEVLGDNQTGKTTVLLYLANLLGYDFFNEDNIEFLGDENLVEQGREIFSKLADRMKAHLEISADPYRLSINTEDGWIRLEVIKASEVISFHPFEVKAMSTAFMNSVRPYVDVQFISKGRNFDRQLLMDICNEMRFYVERFHERAGNLMSVLRATAGDLIRKASVPEGVDFNIRKLEIQNELQQLRARHQVHSGTLAQGKIQIEVIEKLFAQLPDVEKTAAFKLSRDIYQLQSNLRRLRQRLQIFEESKEKQKETDKRIKSLTEELRTLTAELDGKNKTMETIENQVNEAASLIENRIEEFLNESEAYRVLRVLRSHEFEILAMEREVAEPDAGKAIEDLYMTAKKWNPSITITDELGGTMEALQANLETARKTILDRILMKTITDQLFKTLEDNAITSYKKYEGLKFNVQTLRGRLTMLKASFEGLKDARPDSQKQEERKLLEKTKREIKITQKKLRDLTSRMKKIDEKGKKAATELERIAISLRPDDPGSIIYITNWTDELLDLRNELNQRNLENEKELKTVQSQIDELEEENQAIVNIILSPEFSGLSKRRDSLDTFMGIMKTLARVLRDWKCLTDQKDFNEDLISLSRHEVTTELNKVINETFEEKCEKYFRMVNERKFSAETIVDFDYVNRVFTCDSKKQNIASLSGGTASVMTVLSLASKTASSLFGTILLVDEFNDVAATLRNEAYKRLQQKGSLGLAFFASPLDKSPLKTRSVELEG